MAITPPPYPLAPPAILSTGRGVDLALAQWSQVCTSLEFDHLAIDLDAAMTPGGGERTDQARRRRASLLLYADRFELALAELQPDPDAVLPTAATDVRFEHLILATARAALGDDPSLEWLLSTGSKLSHSDAAVLVADCILRVALARGDQSLADAAYRQLRLLGSGARRTVPGIAALVIGERTAYKRNEGAPPVVEALEFLHRSSGSFVTDPQPVLDTVALLEQRGDRSGALLLAATVDVANPGIARVRETRRRLVPPRSRTLHALLLAALWVLGALAVVATTVWAAPLITAAWLLLLLAYWLRGPIPGLSRADTRLYHLASEKVSADLRVYRRPNPMTAAAAARAARRPWPWQAVVGMSAGGFTGLFLGFAWHALSAAVRGVEPETMQGNVLAFFLLTSIGFFGTLGALIGLRLRLRSSLRKVPRPEPIVTGPGRCPCWDNSIINGPQADAYPLGHLDVQPWPEPLGRVAERHPEHAMVVLGCPQTGAAWLRLTLAVEGGAILLRSPLAGDIADAPEEDPDDTRSTGMYL